MPKIEPKYRFVINSLGEIIRWNNEVETCCISSVCISDIARKVLTPHQYERYSQFNGDQAHKDIEKVVQRGINAEFRRQERAELTPKEMEIARKTHRFQTINHDRFRVYGGIDGRTPYLQLVTEFLELVEKREFWKTLRQIARDIGCKVNEMYVDDCLDKSGTKDIENIAPGRTLLNDGKPDEQGYIWSVGPNHGKKERQVEFIYDISHLTTVAQVRKEMKRLTKETEVLWATAGVGVI